MNKKILDKNDKNLCLLAIKHKISNLECVILEELELVKQLKRLEKELTD